MTLSSTVIGQFDLFNGLDKAAHDVIGGMMSVKFVQKGQYIISTGSEGCDVFFLVSGKVRVCFFAENGKQVHFDDLEPGTMFGELSAIDNKGRSSDCISVTECQLAVLSGDDFRTLISQYASVQNAVLTRLAAMVRINMRKVYEFSAFSVSQRIRFELLRLASAAPVSSGNIQLSDVPTHAEIATRVNTHREAVTRELNSLIAKDIITWKHSEHIIHDVVALSDT